MANLYPLKFKTIFKEKLWGGQKAALFPEGTIARTAWPDIHRNNGEGRKERTNKRAKNQERHGRK